MKVIGITGGTGCGKTTALQVLKAMGARIIDCDAVYHTLLETCEPMRQEIRETFPGCMVNGRFDRKALGSIVFADPDKLQKLNDITHGYVFAAVNFQLDQASADGCPAAAVDAIGLMESGLSLLCHTTVAGTAPLQARLQRLMARDGISEEYARSRIDAQRTNEDFASQCRHVLCNDGTKEEFERQCQALFTQLLHERSFHCERE